MASRPSSSLSWRAKRGRIQPARTKPQGEAGRSDHIEKGFQRNQRNQRFQGNSLVALGSLVPLFILVPLIARQSPYSPTPLLPSPGHPAHHIHIIIFSHLVPDFFPAPTAAMNDHESARLLIDGNRIHQFPAFRQTIARAVAIDVKRPQALRTMIAATGSFKRLNVCAAVRADERFLTGNKNHKKECSISYTVCSMRGSDVF